MSRAGVSRCARAANGHAAAAALHRAGRSRWWTILAFVPLVNLIGLWVFAFTRWPNRALAVG
jgi:hypothetical protein